MNELLESIIVRMTYIYRFKTLKRPAYAKIIPHHSSPVPTLLVRQSRSEAEMVNPEIRPDFEEYSEVLMTLNACESESVTVDGQVMLKSICEIAA